MQSRMPTLYEGTPVLQLTLEPHSVPVKKPRLVAHPCLPVNFKDQLVLWDRVTDVEVVRLQSITVDLGGGVLVDTPSLVYPEWLEPYHGGSNQLLLDSHYLRYGGMVQTFLGGGSDIFGRGLHAAPLVEFGQIVFDFIAGTDLLLTKYNALFTVTFQVEAEWHRATMMKRHCGLYRGHTRRFKE
ncbi:hypothetical protein E2C01_074168 [Portunus trituberculatus]|uniref:Uncharacterized protein n=1 Tax=Portunus trituberculatus TaxID=210409 RepID=A0A5B7I2P6_PORTR|nr:hypothetical protein [Portunus trituberculatus]